MTIINDFSNWAPLLLDRAKLLIEHENILNYNATNDTYSVNTNAGTIYQQWLGQVQRAHIFWLSFGVGVECLSKAVLLKHQQLSLNKKNFSTKTTGLKNNYVIYAYQNYSSEKVAASTNAYLKNEFSRNSIVYTAEIKTPTIGEIIIQFRKLKIAAIINSNELINITESLQVFADLRRNVDAHIFLKTTVLGSKNNDLQDVYVPLINLLLDVYKR